MRGGAAALAATFGGTADISAQEQKPAAETQPAAPQASETVKGPNAGHLSISAGVDWTSAYFFRGIKQETEDLILQPYGELAIKLVDQAGALTKAGVTVLYLGDNLTAINDGDRTQVIGTVGLAFAY